MTSGPCWPPLRARCDLHLQPNNPPVRSPARRPRVRGGQRPKAPSCSSTRPTSPLRRRPALDFVKQGKDVIVLRTFSKLYGMAGIRMALPWPGPTCCAASARSAASARCHHRRCRAKASLLDPGLVPTRKKIIATPA